MFPLILYRNFLILHVYLTCYTKFDWKILKEHTLDDLLHLGQLFVVTSEKKEVTAKDVTERPTTLSQWLVQQIGLSHTSTYHILHFIAYPYKILIQCELKPANSPKRAEFCQLQCHTRMDVGCFSVRHVLL